MQILVFGMHRSGTSVVARLLNMMGVYFGPEGIEMPAHATNAKGFWERKDVNELCIRLLRSANCDWHRLSRFNVDQIPAAALEEFRERARQIILGLDAHRPWFVKEPRLCVLAPLWLELLEAPICLFVHRSPIEVARSLEMRDHFPLSLGVALWERYNVDALNATIGRARIQVSHADFIAKPSEALRALAQKLEAAGVHGLSLPSDEEICAFIEPSLYRARHKEGESLAELTSAQRKLRDALRKGTAIRRVKPIAISGVAQEILALHDQTIERRRKITELEKSNTALSIKVEELQNAHAQSRNEIEQTRTKLLAREKELAEKSLLLKAVKEETSRSTAVSRQVQETLRQGFELLWREAKAEAEVSQLQKELIRREANISKLQQDLLQREANISKLQQDLLQREAKAEAKISQLQEQLLQREANISKLQQDLKEQAKAASALQTGLNQAIARRDVALAEQRTKTEELIERIRILKQTLDAVEGLFRQLRDSRWFNFAIYTARRLGLISRTPRRLVEAIKDQFPAMRRALKQLVQTSQGAGSASPAPAAEKTANSPKDDNADSDREIAEARAQRTAASARNALTRPTVPAPADTSVCLIILHRRGEHHLQNLFNSFLKVNTFPSIEFTLVLHECTDGSRGVIDSFRGRLPIKVIDCAENRSFAYSNNRAAEQTKAEYLVFLNNDVIIQEDVVPELLRCLQDSRTGLAGVRLVFPADHPNYPRGLQHAGIKFRTDPLHFFHRPFNLGAPARITETPPVLEKFPAVTAALVACRRSEFLAVGGFCESYLYGYEDVDLGLSFERLLGLRSVSANYVASIHNESATGRLDLGEAVRERRLNNIAHLVRRHGWYLRRKISADKIRGGVFFSEERLTVAFAVTEATAQAAAGDFFSASELGEACAKEFGWKIRFLARNEDWYDLRDVDVLIVLLDAYELSKVHDARPDLVKVAWMRNWFERWASRPDFDRYDLFLCSSKKSAEWLGMTHRKPAWVFPLATNPDRFADAKPEPNLRSDYCFTGSNWKFEREISTAVQPEKLDGYKFAVFGQGWESHPVFKSYARGFLPYAEMPKVYASTRIVVDDANHVTKEWGSVNSRVFDGLVAGALVITNSDIGAAEVFDRELPAYHSPAELQTLLRRYLDDETERRTLSGRLRQRVLSRHTYRHRARTLKLILLSRARNGYRIAFKIGAPTRREIQHWGDYHFARSLGRSLAAQGHSFRIDCIDEWEGPASFGDDVVLVLRGLSRYHPKQGQINLMWNISHPDKIEDEEYEEFDHVFIASQTYADELGSRLRTSVSALLQCTDPYVFYPDPNPDVPAESLLFVGNSRKQYREAVRFAVEAEMPIGVYGTHWSLFIPPHHIRREYIDNAILRQYYSRCDILLNDHWPSMRERGFISNRLFDGAAAGAFILSDAVQDGSEIFGQDLVTYNSEKEFRDLVAHYLKDPEERRLKAARLRERVLADHTFAQRAAVITKRIRQIDSLKRSGETLRDFPVALAHV